MTYYEILMLPKDSSTKEIEVAYEELCKVYNSEEYEGGAEEAEKMLKKLEEAYATLSDPEKRKEYDETLESEEKEAEAVEEEKEAEVKEEKPEKAEATMEQSPAGKKKSIISFISLIVMVAVIIALGACIAVKFFGGADDETDAPDTTPNLEGEDGDVYAQMDYMAEDLSQYVTLGQYKGLEIEAIRPIVSDDEIEAELWAIVDANTTYEPYDVHVTDRVTERGDFINIDYVGTIDGVVDEGASNQGDSIVLAENNGFLDWFEDDLYGVMPGTTVVTTGNFPDDYYEDIAGKEVTFEITVNYIAGHYTIPELNDEFITEVTGSNIAEYTEFLREVLQSESDSEYELGRLQTMWQQVLNSAEIVKYPENQVMYYYTSQRSMYEAYAAQYGYTYEDFLAEAGVDDNYIYEMMQSRVAEELIFYAIVKAEGIEVTQEDYANGIIEYAASQGVTEAELVEQYGEEYIRECVLWDKVIVYLSTLTNFIEE